MTILCLNHFMQIKPKQHVFARYNGIKGGIWGMLFPDHNKMIIETDCTDEK